MADVQDVIANLDVRDGMVHVMRIGRSVLIGADWTLGEVEALVTAHGVEPTPEGWRMFGDLMVNDPERGVLVLQTGESS